MRIQNRLNIQRHLCSKRSLNKPLVTRCGPQIEGRGTVKDFIYYEERRREPGRSV